MKIKLQRTGGFGGINLNAELDTADLSQDNSAALNGLLQKLLPLKQPEKSGGGMDLHDYKLEIVDDDGKHQSVQVDDMNATEAMQEFFEFVFDQVLGK